MTYKLVKNLDGVKRIADGVHIPANLANSDWQEYLIWRSAGNSPLAADEPTPEQAARNEEFEQANSTARQYFQSHPAAVAFFRLSPVEQEAQIDGMTNAQLKEVVKYLAIAVSALAKKRYL